MRQGLPDRRDAEAREGRHRLRRRPALCVGCKSCIAACPWGTPQWDPATRKVVKCDYCMDRVDAGLQPACVTKCVTGCLSFGVANEVPDPRRERYARCLLAEPLQRRRRGGSHERTPAAAGVARRGRGRPGGRRAAGADPRRRAAGPRPGPGPDARCSGCSACSSPASPNAARAGEPIHLAWRRFLRGHGPSVLVIDATGLDARAAGTAAVLDGAPWLLAEGVLIAAGLRDSRQGRTAPAGRADRPRGGAAECRRRHPLAGQRPVPHSADRGAAQQPAELLGRGTGGDALAAGPHAGDLVPDRPAVRRRVGPRCVAADAAARPAAARPGRARARRQPARARSTTGAAASRCRARTRCWSSTTGWAASCRCRRPTCRATRCASRRPASSRRRPP